MSDKMKKFKASVIRIGYRQGDIIVEAASKEEAVLKAKEQAGDHNYSSEYHAEYETSEADTVEIIDKDEEPASELPHCIGCGAVIDRLTAQTAVKANLAVGMSTYSLNIVCTGCKRWLHIELGPGAKVLSMSVKEIK